MLRVKRFVVATALTLLVVFLTAQIALARGGGGRGAGAGAGAGGFRGPQAGSFRGPQAGGFQAGGARNFAPRPDNAFGPAGAQGLDGARFNAPAARPQSINNPFDAAGKVNGLQAAPNRGQVDNFLNNARGNFNGNPAARAEFADTHHFAADNKPFTADWYRDHPNAWRAMHPHADAWAVASYASAAAWLGLAADPVAYVYPASYATTEVVPSNEEQVESAGDLVNAGDLEPNVDSGVWMQLGVYELLPPQRSKAQQMVQMSINKDGAIQGAYYDVVSDTTQPLYGSIDKSNQRAAWTVGSGDGVTFETTLDNLTQNQGAVILHFRNGESQQWTLLRQAPASDAAPAAAN